MRSIPFPILQEEDWGTLSTAGPVSSDNDTVPTSEMSEGDRYEAEYFQRQLNNATAQRDLAEIQIEEARERLLAIQKKYESRK